MKEWVSSHSEDQEPYNSEGKSYSVQRHPETWEPRYLTVPEWGSVQGEGHPETWERRNHIVLRERLLSRGLAAPREGYCQLSRWLRRLSPHSTSSFLPFIASFLFGFFQWVNPGRKISRKRFIGESRVWWDKTRNSYPASVSGPPGTRQRGSAYTGQRGRAVQGRDFQREGW